MFESIGLDHKQGFQQHAQTARRKSFALKPLEVGNGKLIQRSVFVFPKGHLHIYYVYEYGGVGRHAAKMRVLVQWKDVTCR